MDKQQATGIIRDTFENPFDKEKFTFFIRNLLNTIDESKAFHARGYVKEMFEGVIRTYERLGTYEAPDGKKIDIIIAYLQRGFSLDHARSTQRNFAGKYLSDRGTKDAGLFAFVSPDNEDWRFSLVKMEYKFEKIKTGKPTVKEEFTPARRWSFLVGANEKSHTAQSCLIDILSNDQQNPSLEEIEKAFDIETVTKEFFLKYRGLFIRTKEELDKIVERDEKIWADFDAKGVNTVNFAKKLLGQIVFLYFLQKKGWFGVGRDNKWGTGSKRFLRELFEKKHGEYENFFNDALEHLFYDALRTDRSYNDDYFSQFNCKIPFLNGGLFDPIGNYDWVHTDIILPDELFSNTNTTNEGDTGDGILDIFDRYNFTVKEDEPLEKEVAVDPEMLGKVFENMLEVKERKSKGSFYTPREVVHYMCQESLIHYLDNVLNTKDCSILKKDLEFLVRKGHMVLENDQWVLNKGHETGTYKLQLPEPVRKCAVAIDEVLASIRVCDPAIGSGAFPVGLLHEIVNARLALARHSKNSATTYELKRHAILESIYGVDIDASAIDIARLRLWLSLIVDEENYKTIEPLPNLDYKIVRGDSLIGFPENLGLSEFERIEVLKKKFSSETDPKEKLRLKTIIDKKVSEQLDSSVVKLGWQVDFDFRLLFSEVWHEKGGFDVVIGNPPYVQIQKFSNQQIQKDWEKQGFETFKKTGDIYCLFYEKGYRILRENGVLSFITSNKWMRAAYGGKLRQFFSKKTQPLALIDFSSFQVFATATVDTNVLLFRKMNGDRSVEACLVDSSFNRTVPLETFAQKSHIKLDDLSGESWVICNRAEYEIKRRIEAVGTPLKDWNISIYRGILTGFNEAFIIDGKKKDELIAQDPKSVEIIKPILRGRDIKRYRVDFADLWLINTHNGYGKVPPIDVNNYPAIKAHLDQFGDKLKKRQDKGVTPYNLRNCAYLEEFEREKIVYPETMRRARYSDNGFPRFTLDVSREFLIDKTAFIFIGENLRWLLALLNSEIITFLIPLTVYSWDDSGFLMQKIFVEKLSCKQPDAQYQIPVETLADYRMVLNGDYSLQSAYFEQLIDGLVYELYFPEELKVAGKEILPYLGELTPITKEMSENEKLAIIQREFTRLYDPHHPVRNNLDTLDTVEVVRTIREALKK